MADLPLSRVLRWWGISLVCTTFVTLTCALAWRRELQERAQDPEYTIRALVQSSPEVEALPTAYLVELLGLSRDRPVNLYAVSLGHLRERLLSSPVIRWAEVQRRPPGTLEVRYQARVPIAAIKDLENGWVDEEGVLFPGQPFQRPRHLMELYLGLSLSGGPSSGTTSHLSYLSVGSGERSSPAECEAEPRLGALRRSPAEREAQPRLGALPRSSARCESGPCLGAVHRSVWGAKIPEDQRNLLLLMLQDPMWNRYQLQMLDLSRLHQRDYGGRELVMRVRPPGWGQSWWVRLSVESWQDGLCRLRRLHQALKVSPQPLLVDLRMDQIALYRELEGPNPLRGLSPESS